MCAKNIYLDESGYTGPNLKDSSQPYLYVAAVCFSDEELCQLKKDNPLPPIFSELHFSKLYGSSVGRIFLLTIFKHPLMNSSHIKKARLNKRYALYAKIVDDIIEPLFYSTKNTFYEKGIHRIILRVLYFSMVNHPTQSLVNLFEDAFVEMMSKPSEGSIQEFHMYLDFLINNIGTNQDLRDVLELVKFKCNLSNVLYDKWELETSRSLFVPLIEQWYLKEKEIQSMIFDSSKPIKALIDKVQSLPIHEFDEKYDKYFNNSFPLKTTLALIKSKLVTADSKDNYGIQIADLVASAANFIKINQNPKMEPFRQELSELPLFQNDDFMVEYIG